MTAQEARALVISQLMPRGAMVRISRVDTALLVCDALEAAHNLQDLGWRVACKGKLLHLDLAESDYRAMANKAFSWPHGPWQDSWAQEQAFLTLECQRVGPWRGPSSERVIRRAMLSSAGNEASLRRGIKALRAVSAFSLRSGGDDGIRVAAQVFARALWERFGIPCTAGISRPCGGL